MRYLLVVLLLCFGTKGLSEQPLLVGTSLWLPYDNVSNEEAPGFSTEVIQSVFSRLAVPIDIHEYPWSRAQADFCKGVFDALYSAFYTEARTECALFPSEPLFFDRYLLFVRTEDRGGMSFEYIGESKRYVIGLVRGGAYPERLLDDLYEEGNYFENASEQKLLEMLALGRIDAVLTSERNGDYLVASLGLTEQVVPLRDQPLYQAGVYMMFSRQRVSSEFVSRFSQELREFKKTPEFIEIQQRYFPQ